jgi:hypothetical protein
MFSFTDDPRIPSRGGRQVPINFFRGPNRGAGEAGGAYAALRGVGVAWLSRFCRHCSIGTTLGERNHLNSPGFHGVVVNNARSSSGKVHSRRVCCSFVTILPINILENKRDKKITDTVCTPV